METLLPGTEVEARHLRWEVVFSQSVGEQILYRLRCLAEGSLRGKEFDLLSPFETITPIAREFQPEKAAPLVHWCLYHQAFLLEQALGPDALLVAQPGRLRIEPYQLVPVMRALRMSRPRLLLADSVGLGKTIQAGLICAELIARRRAHRILIVSPAGPLLIQWKTEMLERFGLRFTVLDQAQLKEIRCKQELGANVFDYEALGLISIDFAKQEKVLQELERTQYDVVIIDESHHCTRLGAVGEREDSLRRRLAEVLAQRSDCLLLLSATPHDGYDPHFSSLIELLDPSLVDGQGKLRGEKYRQHIIRRLKKHITHPETGKPLFQERQVKPIEVPFDEKTYPHFTQFQEGIIALIAPQLKQAVRQRRYGDVLAFVSLLKRSVSTVQACKNTLKTIHDRLTALIESGTEEQEKRQQRLKTLRDYRRRVERFGCLSFEEEQDQANLEAEDIASELAETPTDDFIYKLEELKRDIRHQEYKGKKIILIRDGIKELVALADKALTEDPKLDVLLQEVMAIRQKESNANILIYTEYTDSQDAVLEQLKEALNHKKIQGEILAISGADDEKKRVEISRRFGEKDLLILVSTDATAEGLNLHQRCHHLIHIELPYNPNRLEQRNGRIDRYGQLYEPKIGYLYLAKTFEERLLLRLVAKYEKQRARLTFVPDILGDINRSTDSLEVKLLDGIAKDQLELFEKTEKKIVFNTKEEDISSSAYRDLLEEIEKAFSGFQNAAKTNSWLSESGLNTDKKFLNDAHKARDEGIKLGAVDLLSFVLEAIRADSSGNSVQNKQDIYEIQVPAPWRYGLEKLPGYDSSKHLLRLTTKIEMTRDSFGNEVGFLGRAHPIVRRALDRVRNIQLSNGVLDRRVSVAFAKIEEPAMLFTFLGSVQSESNREFERVLAVKYAKENTTPEIFLNYLEWQSFVSLKNACATEHVWKNHFASWGTGMILSAQKQAETAFEPISQQFITAHKENLTQEEQELKRWLEKRSEEICGPFQPAQEELFQTTNEKLPSWKTSREFLPRLTSYASDSNNSPKTRHEAKGVVSLYQMRMKEITRRRTLQKINVIPLGILMLIPETLVK